MRQSPVSPASSFSLDSTPWAPSRMAGGRRARLRQQELSSHTVTFSPKSVITLYFVLSFVFVPFGAAIVAGSAKMAHTDRITYHDVVDCDVGPTFNATQVCTVEFEVEKEIRAPSYMYYSVRNMFQNARKYVKSRSDVMMQGMLPEVRLDVSNCAPILYRDGIEGDDGDFDNTAFEYPCGLTARSRFNDTFRMCYDDKCEGKEVAFAKKGIAWTTDVNHKFQPGTAPQFKIPSEPDNRTANELLVDEDFIVWMRLSAFSDFDKLYGIINEDIPPGTYHMRIESNYPVAGFDGGKQFYISTTAWFGAKNTFLGGALLAVGGSCLLIACILLARHVLNPRPPASSDPTIVLRELAKLNLDYGPSPEPAP